ncbi:class I SAM-dependent methyltransferase [Streptomyces sp. NBC_01304]|uniref:class I SAM-dependent methyltransferase n=1 Tax=Streptomyces sp. NBC_01304 TaxID=2903818 RepID=UPI002E0E12BE|nr:methyltransferase domain-containing protein [Streptomyces sp. NBC_01304]
MTPTSRALSFDSAAEQYAANRPSYPPGVLDAVEEIMGRPLEGARVADIGAGTGIGTALLRERGAVVTAVEPGDGMARQFRRTLPDVPVVRGDGNALPLADASHDLITYAQSWHWTDTARSVPEALRVLRPGGALAVWWNTDAGDVPWAVAQTERIARHCKVPATTRTRPDDSRAARLAGVDGLDFARRQLRWSRVVPLDMHLANISSHSAFLVLGEAGTREFLDAERARLCELFPDGDVEETYVVDLLVARSPGGR